MPQAEPTPDRWVIHTIRLARIPGNRVEAVDNLTGAKATATSTAGALAGLALEIEAAYLALRARTADGARCWPHERRELECLERFYREDDPVD